jgi:hypothetical protein
MYTKSLVTSVVVVVVFGGGYKYHSVDDKYCLRLFAVLEGGASEASLAFIMNAFTAQSVYLPFFFNYIV